MRNDATKEHKKKQNVLRIHHSRRSFIGNDKKKRDEDILGDQKPESTKNLKGSTLPKMNLRKFSVKLKKLHTDEY